MRYSTTALNTRLRGGKNQLQPRHNLTIRDMTLILFATCRVYAGPPLKCSWIFYTTFRFFYGAHTQGILKKVPLSQQLTIFLVQKVPISSQKINAFLKKTLDMQNSYCSCDVLSAFDFLTCIFQRSQ